jgi:imidazolonepropionase-like amidohydrolase
MRRTVSTSRLRDLINMGKMTGPPHVRLGHALMITRSTAPPAPIGILADGVDGVLRAVRQVIASGADWVKMRGSTGGFDDVTQFQTFTFEEMKGRQWMPRTPSARRSRSIRTDRRAPEMPFAPASIRWSMERISTTRRSPKWSRRNTYYAPTIDHNQYYIENADSVYHFPAGSKERLRDYIRRNVDTAQKAFRAGVRIIMGSDAVYNGWGLNTRELDWFVKIG